MKELFGDEPYFRVMQLIDGIHHNSRKYAERYLKPLNMTYPQLGVLMVLHEEDGITQRELADLLETDTTTVTVLCDSLEKRGWLKRTSDATDRRVNRLVLTDNGRSIYEQALTLLHTGFEYMLANTPTDESKRAIPFLEELHRNIRALLEGGKGTTS
jgi:DNA-binding MarR family transcriptional regulator